MRIGLIRHFPVEQQFPRGCKTGVELHQWRQQYDASPAILGRADLGAFRWTECISSDMERAVATAKAIFHGPVEQTPLLREPDFAQFGTGGLRLPVWAWRWILGLSWATGHPSQRACRDEFRRRVTATADLLEAKAGDLLVVSHAGMMMYLSAELLRRGFGGTSLRMPKHATLYLYEKNPAPGLAATSSEAGEARQPGHALSTPLPPARHPAPR